MPNTLQPALRGFRKNAIVLFSWTALAHVLSTTSMFLLPRLFGPAEFGVLALFSGTAVMLGIVAAGRYEFAIGLPESAQEAGALFTLCAILTAISGSALLLVAAIAGWWPVLPFLPGEIRTWGAWLAIAVSSIGCYNAVTYVALRLGRFDSMGKSKAVIAAITGIWQIAAGIWLGSTAGGLIVPFVVGQIAGWLYILRPLPRSALWTADVGLIRNVAYRYRSFPKYVAPASLADGLSLLLPTAAISLLYSPAEAGLYALADRALKAPVTLAGSSILQAFYKRAAELRGDAKATQVLLLSIWRHVALAAAIPFGILALFGETIFEMVFGSAWIEAGAVAALLAFSIFFYCLSYPTSNLLIVYERSRSYLLWQTIQLGAIALSFVAARTWGAAGVLEAMWFLVPAQIAAFVLSMALQWHVVSRGSPLTRDSEGIA